MTGGRGRKSGASDRPRLPTSRSALVRDTAIILGGALLAIAASQLSAGGPGPTSTVPAPAEETGPVVVTPAGLPTLPPVPTLGPIVNPSVHIDATPTPVPFATLRPRT